VLYTVSMTTQTLIRKLNKEVSDLQKDMSVVKKMLFAASDPEGKYKASFVKKILKRSASRGLVYRFTTKEAFLHHVRSPK
jgi:hypothetical protein